MYFLDAVKSSIIKYPSLYLTDSIEGSIFRVAHYLFFCLGNGYEWAHTKNPTQGGYLTTPETYKKHGDYFRKYDPPYGSQNAPDIKYFNKLFTEEVYSVPILTASQKLELRKKIDKAVQYKNNDNYLFVDLYLLDPTFQINIKPKSEIPPEDMWFCYPFERSSPGYDWLYPNSSKEYHKLAKVEPDIIQQDWRLAALNQLFHWQKYFNDENRVKNFTYHPSQPNGIKSNKKWTKELNTYKSFINEMIEKFI